MKNYIISRNLKALMEERDLTQVELAAILGVTKGNISQWITGIRPVPRERQAQIEKYFQLPEGALRQDYSQPVYSMIPCAKLSLTIQVDAPPEFYRGDEVIVQTGVLPKDGEAWVVLQFHKLTAGIVKEIDEKIQVFDFDGKAFDAYPRAELIGKVISLSRNFKERLYK